MKIVGDTVLASLPKIADKIEPRKMAIKECRLPMLPSQIGNWQSQSEMKSDAYLPGSVGAGRFFAVFRERLASGNRDGRARRRRDVAARDRSGIR